jgi:hypothetical protein
MAVGRRRQDCVDSRAAARRAVDAQRAAERLDPVGKAAQPAAAFDVRATGPVIVNRDGESAVLHPDPDGGASGGRVLRNIRKRFSAHEVDAGKLRERTIADLDIDVHVDRAGGREVVERGAFRRDWFTQNVSSWEPMMEELDGRGARALEIGSFEGLSACYVLWRLPDSHVTCVDTFEGGPELIAGQHLPDAGLETAFDANVALVDASRVRKLVGDSKRVLVDLLAERARFDFVYVDGSHLALDVLADAALSWRLLATGGFLVFDDYNWAELGEDRLLRPGAAVDSFLVLVEGKYELVSSGWQLALRKSAA